MQFFIKSLIDLPLTPFADGWDFASVYDGFCGGFSKLSIHISSLEKGFLPHEVHSHDQSEIFFVLSGTLEVINENCNNFSLSSNPVVNINGFVYFSREYQHTLHAVGACEATYLVIRWNRVNEIDNKKAEFCVTQSQPEQYPDNYLNFTTQPIEQLQIKTNDHVRAHYSQLLSDAGYDFHKDPYDIFLILYEGSIEIVNRQVTSPAVIYFAPGFPHNIRNFGDTPAKYIVFEMED